MKRQLSPLPLIGALFLLFYLLPLSLRPLFILDEARSAEIAREMMATGDWIVPRLNGLDYFDQPVLSYWATAASQSLFGENAFAVRLPSALAIGLTAVMLFLWLRPDSEGNNERSPALTAALVFLGSFGVFGIGTYATADNLLTLLLTLTLCSLFQATEAPYRSGTRFRWLALSGAAFGAAFLCKGFLALAIPLLVVIPYLLWQGRWRDLFRLPWTPLVTALAVALPWSIAVHLQAPDFWNHFFFEQHIGRLYSNLTRTGEPVWYYLAFLPLMALPWSFQFLALARGACQRSDSEDQDRSRQRFAICWFLLPLLVFTAAPEKNLTFILPCFPALAYLLALWSERALRNRPARLFNGGTLVAAIFYLLLMLVLALVQQLGWEGQAVYRGHPPWLIGSSALLLTLILFGLSLRSRGTKPKLLLFAIAPLPLLAITPLMLPTLTLAKQAPVAFLREQAATIPPQTYVLADSGVIRAASWAFRREDIYLLKSRGELAYGVSRPNGAGRFLELEDARQLISEHPGAVVIFAKWTHYRQWRQQLPPPQELQQNHPQGFVLLRY